MRRVLAMLETIGAPAWMAGAFVTAALIGAAVLAIHGTGVRGDLV
jgi:hypothetical protein